MNWKRSKKFPKATTESWIWLSDTRFILGNWDSEITVENLKQQVDFYHHLLSLPGNSLVNEVFRVQESLELPGFLSSTQDTLSPYLQYNAVEETH